MLWLEEEQLQALGLAVEQWLASSARTVNQPDQDRCAVRVWKGAFLHTLTLTDVATTHRLRCTTTVHATRQRAAGARGDGGFGKARHRVNG